MNLSLSSIIISFAVLGPIPGKSVKTLTSPAIKRFLNSVGLTVDKIEIAFLGPIPETLIRETNKSFSRLNC